MMQMLAAGGFDLLTDDVRGPDAHNPRGYFELEAVKRIQRDSAWVSRAVGRAVKVVQPLVTSLPDGYAYRLLWMRRPLEEVLASQRHMLEQRGAAADDLPPERLLAVFRQQHRALECWVAARDDARMLAVDTRLLVASPVASAREVAHFLDVDLDNEAMAAVVDPGLYRRRPGPPM